MNSPITNKSRRVRNSLSQSEIIDAAQKIIQSDGISRLSMRNIAEELKCSVASPYAHFNSIEDIVKGLIIRGEVILTNMLKEAELKFRDPYDQLAEIARAYWKFSKDNKELHKLMFHPTSDGGLIHRKVTNILPMSYRIFLKAIQRAFQTGQIHLNKNFYPAIARTMWAWIYGLVVLDLAGLVSEDKKPLEDGIYIFTELLKKGWNGQMNAFST
jgi:AcrR family transcriptional regulator